MSVKNRYEFVMFFEVVNGNPNGDPDAGNMPRVDQQTGCGLVTDVCIKRKIRNYVEEVYGEKEGYDIFITDGSALNDKMKSTYEDFNLDPQSSDSREIAKKYMCSRYFDVRAFGGVMDTGSYVCGQVRGPVQLCFGQSLEPIMPQEVAITRMASNEDKGNYAQNRTIGRKYIVPYGLYRMEGYFSPSLAEKAGFTDEDLEILWESLLNMFETEHSAARGRMATRKLIVFEHESSLGNAPSVELFDLVKVSRVNEEVPARCFADYNITIGNAPEGVTIKELR